MPANTDIARRDRAVVALVMITGVRDGALVSLKLKHLDVERRCLIQDAREVNTKFSKTFTTWFYPVGDRPLEILADYAGELREVRLWGNDDPLFPVTEVAPNEQTEFAASGLLRRHWANAGPVRQIFRVACARSGLQYFHPHSVRHALVQLGFRVCRTPEELKAWSQNMGHSDMWTTIAAYGEISEWRQAALIEKLAKERGEPVDDALIREAAEFVRKVRGG
jgi:integrase